MAIAAIARRDQVVITLVLDDPTDLMILTRPTFFQDYNQ